ncbi:MAG TPA: site-2 protease family protein [Acetobacteraceae bacterium]|nr:site-2 protease family protein [Acetobacteraceae bacterium]
MSALIRELLIAVIPVVLAITLHEAAHGYAALALGDDTAKRMGRLSLNPIAHIDRFGTIILPGFLLIAQLLTIHRIAFMFGWAKPVPVDARRFRDPRRGMMVVAAAGPAMNFLLAWIAALLLPGWALIGLGPLPFWVEMLQLFLLANLVLGLFNLIPIPPLDGGRIAVGLLPLELARRWARLERAGIIIVLLVVFLLPAVLREAGIAFDPVGAALQTVVPWSMRVVLNLAGHHV